jgi:flavin-dependent amine oxidoreductase
MPTRRQVLRGSLAGFTAAALSGCASRELRPIPGRMIDSGAALGHRLRDGGLPPPSATRRVRVVVAGGGIAGLAAARALRKAGIDDVLLIDALESAGGNSSFGHNAVSAYPWGAHYVPLVRKDCRPVYELFQELRIIVDEDASHLPVYDEYCLSADPQERLWMFGRWQEGLVPQLGNSARDDAEFAAFFAETERLKKLRGEDGKPVFAIPVDASSADPRWRALDATSFTDYLRQRGFSSPRLHWYVNYCCRDDYGCTAAAVSAWAGLHYFAARSGTAANADPGTVITWPEGNGYLVRELARQGGAQQTRSLVARVARNSDGGGVQLDYFDLASQRTVRVEAAAAVLCLPQFVTARVLGDTAARPDDSFSYAPWMVANVTLSQLPAGRGHALAWDNVVYDSPLLGYVVATHQDLHLHRRETVVTYYWPLSDAAPADARRAAYSRGLEEWQRLVAHDLQRIHPELAGHVENIDVRVWGHAMVRPTPGFIWGEARRRAGQHQPPIYFAHSDLGGISIFEEAYCRGEQAGRLAAQRVA